MTDTPLKDEVLGNPRAHAMLEKYAEWLTEGWGKNHSDGTPVEPEEVITWEVEDFFTYDINGERHPHGETRIVSDELVTHSTRVVVMSVGYGDDGGPATLIGVFWGEEDKPLHLLQEFDSGLSIILQTEY